MSNDPHDNETALIRYGLEHTSPPDALQSELQQVTRDLLGDRAIMQVRHDQSVLFEIFVQALGARSAIEVGTFTGYSSLAIARALGEGGHLICCDVSETFTRTATEFWQRDGIGDRIDLRIAPALETLKALPAGEQFDFAFIDAQKSEYSGYYGELVPRLRGGGVLIVDNTLQGNDVLDASSEREQTRFVQAFNDEVAHDSRVRSIFLTIADGMTIVQKR